MARFIMGLSYGDPRQVDHKNREETLDNRRSNLRITTKQNAQNIGITKRNTSGFKGVVLEPAGSNERTTNGWRARIRVGHKLINIGTYSTPEKAARAYDKAALKYHGSFACTNKMLGRIK
jgi:hypothetical protein